MLLLNQFIQDRKEAFKETGELGQADAYICLFEGFEGEVHFLEEEEWDKVEGTVVPGLPNVKGYEDKEYLVFSLKK